jgi:hypothetical protein
LLSFPLTGSFPLAGLALASLRAAGSLLNRTGTTIKRQLKTGFHDPGGKFTILKNRKRTEKRPGKP